MSKRLLNRGTEVDLETSLDDEATFQALVVASEDTREGMDSFRERRKPIFTGK
jgi:enoyl-CoA hydratase/carnithine racemase